MIRTRIEVLNIENNKLGDKMVMKLLKCLLSTTNRVRILNISKNYLTNELSELLKEII